MILIRELANRLTGLYLYLNWQIEELVNLLIILLVN